MTDPAMTDPDRPMNTPQGCDCISPNPPSPYYTHGSWVCPACKRSVYQPFPDANKPKRGGARPGAGRPKGSGQGRKAITSSINLTAETWAKLDALRGPTSRSAWIADRIKKARK